VANGVHSRPPFSLWRLVVNLDEMEATETCETGVCAEKKTTELVEAFLKKYAYPYNKHDMTNHLNEIVNHLQRTR
jgi:hypothetical protein